MSCEQATNYLLAGQLPNDARLEQHIRACLPCYRLATDLRNVPDLAASLKESLPDPGPYFWQQFPERVMAKIPLCATHESRFRWPRWLSIALPSGTLGAAAVAILFFGLSSPQKPRVSQTPPTPARVESRTALEVETAQPALRDMLDELDKVMLGRVAKVFDAEFSKTFPHDLSAVDPIEEIEALDEPALRAVAYSLGIKERI
jgi:anti-sigma factor RsiW